MLLAAALTGAVGTGSCAGATKREARALISAMDRFRHASDASRAADAQAISDVACSDQRVCDAKRACLAAIDPTTRALGLKDEVAHRLADLEQKRLSPDSPDARALPGKLDEAEKLLREGRAKMLDCEKKLNDLELEYGV
jgi:hypothetical protein